VYPNLLFKVTDDAVTRTTDGIAEVLGAEQP
jgi:hypothetical protein